jgi:MFS family permease
MVLTPARNERNVLLLTGVGHFTTHFFELMFPTLAVALARQTELPLDEVLTWSFAGYLLFGLGGLPFGMLADRIGSRRCCSSRCSASASRRWRRARSPRRARSRSAWR